MTEEESPAIPEFVLDHLGKEVRVGDTIAYAALLGRSAALSVSEVLALQWSRPSWGGAPELKIKVQGTSTYLPGAQKKPGYLVAAHRRFVRLEAA